MNKNIFKKLFLESIETAISATESLISRKLSRNTEIELHGAGISGEILSVDDAIDIMYISDDIFYRIIDVGVKDVTDSISHIFVRISDHSPSSLDMTWNFPAGKGPFKVLESTGAE